MKKRMGLTTQAIIIISLLLLTVNVGLGGLMMQQSMSEMKTLIRERMLDISNSAAASLDGDVLGKLTEKDIGSAEYQSISDDLTVFQDNIDLEYIYCIQIVDDGKFAFSVDPTVVDPGEFGYPIAATDALVNASKGTADVDNVPYTDDWGTFYSAYSPVFDSKGNVAGIVAVDFAAEWYDGQIRSIVLTILLSSVLSMIIGGLIIFLITSRLRRKFRQLNDELTGLAAEVEQLTSEISDPSDGSASVDSQADQEEQNDSQDDISNIGSRIRSTRKELIGYLNHVHTREKSMIMALSSDYRSVLYVDLDKDEGICYRFGVELGIDLKEGDTFCYSELFKTYTEKYVTQEFRKDFLRFIDPENIREGLKNDTTIVYKYLSMHDGYEAYELLRIAGVIRPEDGDDGIIHAVSFGFTDVDKETRETMERNRVLSEALDAAEESSKAKTVFLSNMSHEIRTPLSSIIGLDDIALENPEISPRTRDELEKIGISAKHLLNIINDILDMSRIESGRITLKKEEFYFKGVLKKVNTIIGEQCQNKGITYTCSIDRKLDDYYIGDDIKLRQILINILGNSVKFTPEGGKVSLTVQRIARYEGNSTLRFVISDTGIGMDKEFLPHIFDAFSQEDSSTVNRHGSTGLGMAITKRFVEMMNGNIEVDSEKGKGTTFNVTLSLFDTSRSAEDGSGIDFHTLSALVLTADDEKSADIAEELESLGVKSATASTAEKAIETIRLRSARREPLDLMIIDSDMPDTKAADIARQIHAVSENDVIAVILAVGDPDAFPYDMEGADAVIAKSHTTDQLSDAIRHALIDVRNKAEAVKTVAELSGRRILLAEDTEINSEIMKMVLGSREMEVDLAVNGKIAVEKFESHPAGYYDAILMDMRMPEMDGLTATSVIRAMDRPDAKKIPIIALTANAFDEDVQRSMQVGLNAHLSKPIEQDKLFSTLEILISD